MTRPEGTGLTVVEMVLDAIVAPTFVERLPAWDGLERGDGDAATGLNRHWRSPGGYRAALSELRSSPRTNATGRRKPGGRGRRRASVWSHLGLPAR
jgi:hypothetical protein